MQTFKRIALAAATVAAVAASAAGPASAQRSARHGAFGGSAGAVFVQTDNLAANAVVAYDRAADGTLRQAGVYDTGGLGGQLTGSVVDHLASQGSLAYDRRAGLLYAVNAGSNTVSVFAVSGDRLARRQVIGSGGTFPVSIAVHGGLVYVLNAENGGAVDGFWQDGERLVAIPGSGRPLGLNPAATPQFVTTPGQVAFSRDGSQLIVTTKANGNDVDVFRVFPWGLLSQTAAVNSLPGTVPFGIALDRDGNLVIAEAGTDALASFVLRRDGTIDQLATVATGQAATCWVVRAGDRFYASNAGSASLSDVQAGAGATTLTLLGQTTTDAGTVDGAATRNGRYVYVQTGAAGIVDEFAVDVNGSLTSIGSVVVPGGAGGEGIVAG
jgi:hypothetical protein